jgi:filamentous hemagglutinin
MRLPDDETGQFLGNDVWRLGNGERGMAIEDYQVAELGEEGRLPQNFKTFDHYDPVDRVATSIKSYDARNGYSDPQDFYNAVKGDIDSVADFHYYELSDVELNSDMIDARFLDVNLPADASRAHMVALERAIAYAGRRGVNITTGFWQ